MIVDGVVIALAVVASWSFLVLTVEALLALFPIRQARRGQRVPCGIVIPAHNEEATIATTVSSLRTQCMSADRILVVADNCTDATATFARTAGAEVIERTDHVQRGKGYALAFGFAHFQEHPPAVIVVVDADCELAPGALAALVEQVQATQRPAQGIYQIGTGTESDRRQRLSAFAVLFKNQVRPLGLHRVGLPCLLTGTGMAFPWVALQQVSVGSGNIVEDMKLGLDMAIAGYPPQLCTAASLRGAAAPDRRSAAQQRTRWEHGHVLTILTQGPRLLLRGLCGRPKLLGLACEVCVPPLALVVLIWAMVLVICVILWQCELVSRTSVVILLVSMVAFATAIFLSWLKYARSIISLWVILSIPLYLAWKIPIYVKLLFSRQKNWNRTKRA